MGLAGNSSRQTRRWWKRTVRMPKSRMLRTWRSRHATTTQWRSYIIEKGFKSCLVGCGCTKSGGMFSRMDRCEGCRLLDGVEQRGWLSLRTGRRGAVLQ